MDQTQGPARYHTHFYDVAGADHGGVARRHGLLPAPMTSQELQEQPALLRARGHSHRDSVLMPALSPVPVVYFLSGAVLLALALLLETPSGPVFWTACGLAGVMMLLPMLMWAAQGIYAARQARIRTLIRARLGDDHQLQQRRAHVRSHGALPAALIAGRDQVLPASDDPVVLQRLARTSADLMNASPHLPVLAVLVSADTPLTLRQVQDRAEHGLTATPRKAVRAALEQMEQNHWVLTDWESTPRTYQANRDRPGFVEMLQLLSLDTNAAALLPQDQAPLTPGTTAGQDPDLLARAQTLDLHNLNDRVFFEVVFAQQIPLFGLHEQQNARQLAAAVAAVEQLISSTAHADPTDELATTLQQLRSRLRMTTDEPSMGAPPMIALQALTAEHNAQAIEEAIAQIRARHHDIAATVCADALHAHARALRQLIAQIHDQPDMQPLLAQLDTP